MFILNLFILSSVSILLEERGCPLINEVNIYKNNYSLECIDTSKLECGCAILMLQNVFPLSLNITNEHIIRLYLLCLDLITEEDLLRIDSILGKCKKNVNVPIGSSGLFNSSCFSKPIILIRFKEIFDYISTNSFFNDLNPEVLKEYSDFLNSKLYFKKFSSKIVYIDARCSFVYNLTVPEYFILGMYYYLKNNTILNDQESQKQIFFEQLISCT